MRIVQRRIGDNQSALHSTSNYRTSGYLQSTTVSMASTDYVKIILICVFSLFCVYTYFDQYFQINLVTYSQANQSSQRVFPSKLEIKADDSVCNKFSDALLTQCRQEFVNGANEATNECDGYYQRLRSCSSNCNTMKSNVESCIMAVLRKVNRKWEQTFPSAV